MRKKSTPSSNKWLTLLFACLLLSCTVCNAATTETLKPDTITLSLTEAGTLHERIGNNKKLKIECLRLKGMLNIDDIQFIREMAGCYYDTKGHKYDGHLRYLDISGATLTNTDNKEVSIYPRDPSEYEGTPWPSADAYINDKGTPVAIFAYLYDMEEIVLPAKLKSIGDDAFIFCRSLKSINIPESVQKIGLRAFFGCSSLKSMKLPVGITEIKSGLLSGCTNLTSIDIPYTTEEIGHNAFSKCTSLKSIELPYSLNNMGISVFYGCTALTSVTIPKNIRYISDYTFRGCNSLKSIYALNPQGIGIKGKPFEEYTQSQCTLYVPEGSMDNYKRGEEWNAFNHIVEFSPTGIDGVHSAAERREVERYDTSGRRLTSPTKGLNIVRFNDGTTRKVMK